MRVLVGAPERGALLARDCEHAGGGRGPLVEVGLVLDDLLSRGDENIVSRASKGRTGWFLERVAVLVRTTLKLGLAERVGDDAELVRVDEAVDDLLADARDLRVALDCA